MTLTPAGVARRANACRHVAALLETWGAPHAAERAAQVLDAVDAAGWHPPPDLTHQPEQARTPSTQAGRAAARALYETTRNRQETA